MLTTLSRAAALATMIAGMTAAATAQTTAADPHHPGMMLTQAMPPSGMMGPSRISQGQGAQVDQSTVPPAQPAMMCGMMQPEMMGQGMQGMMGRGTMGMPGPAPMKIFFAIADANGDGGGLLLRRGDGHSQADLRQDRCQQGQQSDARGDPSLDAGVARVSASPFGRPGRRRPPLPQIRRSFSPRAEVYD